MAKAEASLEIDAPLAEVWGLYFERSRWASWVDGFASMTAESGYPQAGGTLSWALDPGRPRPGERARPRPRAADAAPDRVLRPGLRRGARDDLRAPSRRGCSVGPGGRRSPSASPTR